MLAAADFETIAHDRHHRARPARMIRHYWEDFVVGSVREFGAMPVTREAALAFARDFDPQPFHLDDEAAAQSLFGRLAASGWHTCAMAMRMMCDEYVLDSSSLGSPGIDNLRWLKRVPATPEHATHGAGRALDEQPPWCRPGAVALGALQSAARAVLLMEGWGMYRMRGIGPPP
jgi:acyl dehydratase